MYKKLFVPLDGSKLSEGVLPYARVLARRLALPVEVLYVNNPEQRAPHVPPLESADYLAKIARSFPADCAVKSSVEFGEPAAVIVDLAAADPQALVAMATHGRSGAKRWLLGSVAEKVLHAVKNHLLLVRPPEEDHGHEARIKSVVVPLDGSGLAEKVLSAVSFLALRLDLEVVLVRVTERVYTAPPEAFLPVFGAVPNLTDLATQARSAAAEYLTGKVEHLRMQGISKVSSLVLEGGPGGAAAEIIDLAEQTADNLVAMSTHGASGLGRWLIGSITERVVRHSSDPVLVIPAAQ
jgi:nucleotide-binding universal stress UspA family protein